MTFLGKDFHLRDLAAILEMTFPAKTFEEWPRQNVKATLQSGRRRSPSRFVKWSVPKSYFLGFLHDKTENEFSP